MRVKLHTEHHLEPLSLKEAEQASRSLHLSKCHIVGNNMSRLKKSVLCDLNAHTSNAEDFNMLMNIYVSLLAQMM